jgi:tRNA(Ile)-lysidine synthase
MTRQVIRTIREFGLVTVGDRVALAVSGGADSVALVWLMHELAGELGCMVAGLVHVNHGLRGEESAGDERFCRALAERLGWPIEVATVDVAARARAEHRSYEAAAREARYAFFAEAAGRLGATVVATAHTLDDQAETVLLRLIRGAGSRGVAGIRRRRGAIVRPLLGCRRAELRRYLAGRGEPFREDSSNLDESIARNRVRHRLLPVIEDIAPGGIPALARFAELAEEDEAFLNRAAIESARGCVQFVPADRAGSRAARLHAPALATLPRALASRIVRQAIEDLTLRRNLAARHINDVLRLLASDKPVGHLDLPGVVVERQGDEVLIGRTGASEFDVRSSQFEVELLLPGAVDIPEAGVRMVATAGSAAGGSSGSLFAGGRRDVAVVQAASVIPPFVVRSRRAGDRFRPIGAPGRRKIQDLLVDRKVPRGERDRVPIVEDTTGRIVWVAGLALAEECRVTAAEAGVVILQMMPVDGPAADSRR